MRKNIVVIGLILLVIGIVMVGVESVSIEHSGASTLSTQTTMIPSPNGEYHSNLLSVNKNQIVTVVTNSKAYLIPASDISIVNESNVNNYSGHCCDNNWSYTETKTKNSIIKMIFIFLS